MRRHRKIGPEARRAVILTAGRALVRAKGFAALSIWDVAGWCEIHTSAATVKHYFANRQTLARCVIEDAQRLNDRVVLRRAIDANEKAAVS